MDHIMVESDGGNPYSNLHHPDVRSRTIQSCSNVHMDIGSQAGLKRGDSIVANNATQTVCHMRENVP